MLADLDLLLIAVFCAADDLLPKKPENARRIVTDAEVVTLCVAQSMMGVASDARFIAAARKRLGHLFPQFPDREGFYKRREALSDTIEALIAEFASHCPGSTDNVLLVDSTPVECARSRETVKRGGQSSLDDALANGADYGYCASHSRYFYGFRLHTLFAMDGTPRALALTSPKIDEKQVCLEMVARCERQPGQTLTLIGDKNFRGKRFEADLATLHATIHRPRRKDEKTAASAPSSTTPALRPASQITPQPDRHTPSYEPHLAPVRQRIESIYWTFKDILTLERHGARTLHGLRTRLVCRFLALAAAIALNHRLGLPSRSLVQYTA
jgi:hypothetical protein